MPRYFFDIDDGDQRSLDHEGMEMPDVWAAREGAIAVLPDVARDVLPDGDRREMVSTVRDESGTVVYIATLSLVGGWKIDPPPR
jgi:hypothetical protein